MWLLFLPLVIPALAGVAARPLAAAWNGGRLPGS